VSGKVPLTYIAAEGAWKKPVDLEPKGEVKRIVTAKVALQTTL